MSKGEGTGPASGILGGLATAAPGSSSATERVKKLGMMIAAKFGVCVQNRGNPAALEVRKIYWLVEDPSAEERGLVRVIDGSGEDHLHPARFFAPIEVPRAAAKAFSKRSA